jgi:hypothetical protein
VAVLLDHRPAAARGHQQRIGAGLEFWEPRIYVAPYPVKGVVGRGHVMVDGPAAAGTQNVPSGDSEAREQAHGGGVDARPQRRLHAALLQQHGS